MARFVPRKTVAAVRELTMFRMRRRRRIGLFGGSFDPMHDGHWLCAESLRKALRLHEIWWLTTPQNPLKSFRPASGFVERSWRVECALVGHRHHRASTLLLESGCFYTIDFLKFLSRCRSNNRYYWLAGTDVLGELHRWQDWRKLENYCRLAFFSRPGHDFAGRVMGRRLHGVRLVLGRRSQLSATKLRAIKDSNTPVFD